MLSTPHKALAATPVKGLGAPQPRAAARVTRWEAPVMGGGPDRGAVRASTQSPSPVPAPCRRCGSTGAAPRQRWWAAAPECPPAAPARCRWGGGGHVCVCVVVVGESRRPCGRRGGKQAAMWAHGCAAAGPGAAGHACCSQVPGGHGQQGTAQRTLLWRRQAPSLGRDD